jgi:hypothetical protein
MLVAGQSEPFAEISIESAPPPVEPAPTATTAAAIDHASPEISPPGTGSLGEISAAAAPDATQWN